MMKVLLALIPWIAFALVLPVLQRRRPRLRDYPPPDREAAPSVSVIVPTRNEAMNIGQCLTSLLGAEYPDLEVVMVDDRSEDGTGAIAAAIAERSGGRLRIVAGEPLPAGWLGKPWACWQGYRAARGDLLLFTDADTRHGPELIGRAVGALLREDADMVSLLPRQIMRSFWERVIMPQFWLLLSLRYPNTAWVNRARRWQDVIANGQFILVRREAYEAVGGHASIRGEVVEDLKLAQRFALYGRRIFLAHAEELMETRMYRDFAGIVEGWTKNVAIGARQTVDPWLRPIVPWLIVAFLLGYWVLPPTLLVAWLVGWVGGATALWAAGATLISLLFWLYMYVRLQVKPSSAGLYPLGAVLAAWIVVRSALRGERVVWKGREYRVEG